MDVTAQLSSKGQLTVPKAVRDALGLAEGDQVVFRVQGRRALLARTPNLLDLAGSSGVSLTDLLARLAAELESAERGSPFAGSVVLRTMRRCASSRNSRKSSSADGRADSRSSASS